jgi:ABC-type Fe3+-hydroxamate transport system substrate-binding protein
VVRVTDDLGAVVDLPERVGRVVSLVPSLTESVAHTDPDLLVGATDWCTHPAGLDLARVRGTKNPDLAAVRALAPDLVLCNKEENRELDVRRLRESGVAVWVTDIRTVGQALTSLRRLITVALGLPAPDWLEAATASWAAPPPPGPPLRAVIPIWRDPWMVVGADTFTGDLAERIGLHNVMAGVGGGGDARYPHVEVADILARRPEVVVLPDEPYVFTADDGPETFPGVTPLLVPGRLLTWYGPSLATARDDLQQRLTGIAANRVRPV